MTNLQEGRGSSPSKTIDKRSPAKNTTVSGKPSTKAADATKFTFITYKDSTNQALVEELSQLRKTNSDLENRFKKYNSDLKTENEALKLEIEKIRLEESDKNSR